MKPPSPTGTTSPVNSCDDGTDERDKTVANSAPQFGSGSQEDFTAIAGTNEGPAFVGILEELRGTFVGGRSPAWSTINDSARLRAVYDTGLLEPGPHPEVDQVIGLTIEAIGIPNAALNMITDVEQVTAGIASRSHDIGDQRTHDLPDSLCVYTVVSGSPLIVDDIVDHPVLRDHSAAQSGVVGAYIGIPIVDSAGHAVGTLCAWDTHPRHWSSGEIQIMTDLADVVQNVIFNQ